MKKLKVAVIGCGGISVMHLDSIKAFDDVELVAVCDIKLDRAEAASKNMVAKFIPIIKKCLSVKN